MNNTTTAELLPYVKFLFEIDNPSLEECYRHGYQMSMDGSVEQDNPYEGRGEKEAEYWNQGWWDGCYGVAPMFEMEPMATASMTIVNDASEVNAANETEFEAQQPSKITTISKFAAILAGAILSYQVIDMIA